MRAACLLLSLLFAAGCGDAPTQSEIEATIQSARECESDPQCVNLGGRCPFGCDIVVNRAHAERVRKLINDFERACAQSCGPAPSMLVCENRLCTAK